MFWGFRCIPNHIHPDKVLRSRSIAGKGGLLRSLLYRRLPSIRYVILASSDSVSVYIGGWKVPIFLVSRFPDENDVSLTYLMVIVFHS